MSYRVVQPYGRRRNEWTLISEHASARDAFGAIDDLSSRMVQTGAPRDAVRLIVVDRDGLEVRRHGAQ